MKTITLGKTGISTPQNAFGALPIQRQDLAGAERILKRAYDGGMTFFDTARAYSDSEEKVCRALSPVRDKITIATKTQARNADKFWEDLHTSLKLLRTDYIDIYQLHLAGQVYRPGDESGLYDALVKAKEQGKIRHIGITAHKVGVAEDIIASGLYETLQFPLSYISSDRDIALTEACKKADMGFIAMKGLSGGLLTNSAACMAFMSQFDNVVPIWGIQKDNELEEWLSYFDNTPVFNDDFKALIEADKAALGKDFCRGCGYCMPCTVGIKINNAARLSQMIRRSPSDSWLSESWQAEMNKINDCIECGVCLSRCPYELNIPELLRKNLEDYKKILSGEIKVREREVL